MGIVARAPRILLAAFLVVMATPASGADDLELSFDAGRVTVVATEVPLRTILNEWARLGDTTFVSVDQLPNQPVSVEMVSVPEREALRVLLRPAGGYVVAPRASVARGDSTFDRVLIMATSRGRSRRPSVRPPTFQPATIPSFDDSTGSDVPPGVIPEGDDSDVDQLELLEQLRGRYQQEPPPPDLFSQPPGLGFSTGRPENEGDGMQTTPRPGMITAAPEGDLRRGRRPMPVRPQRDDP